MGNAARERIYGAPNSRPSTTINGLPEANLTRYAKATARRARG
jgi:hypothetical protein